MDRAKREMLSLLIIFFLLCFIICETTFYQYESGKVNHLSGSAAEEMKTPETALLLIEHYQPRQTLNLRAVLAEIGKIVSAKGRIVILFLFLLLFASFLIVTKRGERKRSLCRFQTFSENTLHILHKRDGKKERLFLISCL